MRQSYGNHQNIEGRLYTMWIYDTDLYFEIRFISWTSNGQGGGFSYERRQVDSDGSPISGDWLTVEYQEDENVSSAVNFTKDDYADPHLEENQDRITDEIWLTRYDNNGFFNAYTHNDWVGNVEGTEWHWGPASIETNYWTEDWRSAVNNLVKEVLAMQILVMVEL